MIDNTTTASQADTKPFGSIQVSYFLLPLRCVLAWMFFSAAWRRIVLEPEKLVMGPKWVGHKVNHFYPHALLIKGQLEYMITHPNFLWWAMIIFTIIELLVGLGVAFGLLTRISSLGITLLSLSMLLGAGWLGATCLDEWQIGCFGIAGAMALWFVGPGKYSLDYLISKKASWWTSGVMSWFTDGPLFSPKTAKTVVYGASVFTVAAMLITNQAFVGGIWGPLHNPSAKPKVLVSDVHVNNAEISFTVFRTDGPDTYGASVTELQVVDGHDNVIVDLYGKDLSKTMKQAAKNKLIKNYFPNKVKPGPDGIAIPLGAKANITLNLNVNMKDAKQLILRDVSISPEQKKMLWVGEIKR